MALGAFRLFRFCPLLRAACLLAADCFALYGVFFMAMLFREAAGGVIQWSLCLHLAPFLLLMPIFGVFRGLYSPLLMPSHEELGFLMAGSSIAYLSIVCSLFFLQESEHVSRLAIAGAWAASLAAVPLARAFVRWLLADSAWWMLPAIFFGDAARVGSIAERLRKNPRFGIRPVAFAGDSLPSGCEDLELLRDDAAVCRMCERHHGKICALLAMKSGEKDASARRELAEVTRWLDEVILLPDLYGGAVPISFSPVAVGGVSGLRLAQNLLDPCRLFFKRCLDVFCAGIGGILLLPVFALIALCIMLESPGNPFYCHRRIGRGGRALYVLKFRTMVPNADARLREYLERSPELRAEWTAEQKLREDPRITRVGRFLRRSSLDELPQLWNVLKGEMSLVGPRPIVEDEIVRYGEAYELYTRVRPGITGLWQVSGRNDVGYETRVWMDQYYIYNWSLWLDIYILVRTIPAVLGSRGAY